MLAALQVNQRIHGLVPGENVTLIRVDRIDDDLVEVTYRYDDGRTGGDYLLRQMCRTFLM